MLTQLFPISLVPEVVELEIELITVVMRLLIKIKIIFLDISLWSVSQSCEH